LTATVWGADLQTTLTLSETTVRASDGKGFRAPSLFELYKVHVRGGGTWRSNLSKAKSHPSARETARASP
jgi:outer membrane cobalamin receptor